MLGRANTNPNKIADGGIIEISYAEKSWSYTTTNPISIPFANVNATYINDITKPFIVGNEPSNGMNIPANSIVKLNLKNTISNISALRSTRDNEYYAIDDVPLITIYIPKV